MTSQRRFTAKASTILETRANPVINEAGGVSDLAARIAQIADEILYHVERGETRVTNAPGRAGGIQM